MDRFVALLSGSSRKRWRSWSCRPPWPICKNIILLLSLKLPKPFFSVTDENNTYDFLFSKGVAGDRGEQGPPGLNGFQVCVCFSLIVKCGFFKTPNGFE